MVTAPTPLHILFVVGTPGSWSEPHVPVTDFWIRCFLSRQPVILQGWHINGCIQRFKTSKFACMCKAHCLLKVGNATALSARLKDLFSRFKNAINVLTITNRDSTRFFAVNIFSSFGCLDRSRRMPTIAGGDNHCIDIVAREHFTKIAIEFAILIAIVPVDQLLSCSAPRLLHIGDGDTLHVGQLQH